MTATTPAEERPSLGRSTSVMVVGTTLSRITGLARIFAIGTALGQLGLADAYNVANTTPNIVYDLVLGGVLSATLVPVFVTHLARRAAAAVDAGDGGVDEGDEDDGWRAVSAVATAIAVAAAVITVVFFVLAPWVVRLYLAPKTSVETSSAAVAAQREVAVILLRMFAVQVAFYAVVSVTTAILQARRRFAAPMFAPVANNLVVIAVALAFPTVSRTIGIIPVRHDHAALYLLGVGTTAGVAAMAIVQASRLPAAGARLRWVWAPRHPAVRTVLRLSVWTVGFVLANQLALLVMVRLGTGNPGDWSAYTYAMVFFLLPHGVYTVSVMSALEPEMAERWSHGDVEGYRRHFGTGLRSIVALLVPAGVGIAVLAAPLVALVLQHRNFGASDAVLTASVLSILALGLPAYSVYLYLMRTYQAIQDTRSMFWLYVVENAVNIVLALALYPTFGVRGLAASFSLAYGAGTVAALVHLKARSGGLGAGLVRQAALVVAASALMGAAVAAVVLALPGGGTARSSVQVAAGVVVGAGVYVGAARLLGVAEPVAILRGGLHQLKRRAA